MSVKAEGGIVCKMLLWKSNKTKGVILAEIEDRENYIG